MCSHCTADPRDAVAEADSAMLALRQLLNELPLKTDVPANGIGALLSIIHDRLSPAVSALQGYIPRT